MTGAALNLGTSPFARVGPNAAHVRRAVVPVDDKLADGDAKAYVDPRLGLRGEPQGLLEDRPARGDDLEAVIAVAWCPVLDRRRHHAQ